MDSKTVRTTIRKYGIGLILVWTAILSGFMIYISNEFHKSVLLEATREARDYYNLNMHYRQWASNVGGVYANVETVTPNPHLQVPQREIKTENGKTLTLINPAYMTRMVFESIRKDSDNPIINRIVSTKPLNPANAPTPWEDETLRQFESSTIRERFQVLKIDGRPYLQFMAAFITDENCLKCHAVQGYRTGDIRGGISIAIPISSYLAIEKERQRSLSGVFAILWTMGFAGITATSRRRFQHEMRLEEERASLENEVHERLQIQEQLEQQAVLLEEEAAERQKVVETLERTETFLKTIIDTEPECIKLLDTDCRLLYMNRAGLNMVDADNFEDVKGQCVLPLISEAYRYSFQEYNRSVFLGESKTLEFEISGLKGRKLWMQSTAVPFRDESGAIVASLAITRDVTELKYTEKELQKKNSDLEQFIYTTSHDLRTPLVTVKAFLGFLESDMAAGDRERVTQDLQYLHSAADKMKLLLDELLDLSRAEIGESSMEQMNLSDILNGVIASLEETVREQHAAITLPDADVRLFGDRTRLSQIWQNLIENAIKYRSETINPAINLGIRTQDGETVFYVEDNGIGVPPDYHEKIFKMFEKLDSSSPGAGLGLPMIQRIVERWGGRIWVESEGAGKGSCFCFTLPLCIAVG